MGLTVSSAGFRKDGARLLARERLSQAQGVLLDWDGCIAFDNRPDPRALRFLADWHDRVVIVSNNSTNLPEDFAQILAREGVAIAPERILLAGVEAMKHAQETGPARTLLLGDPRMKAFGRRIGLELVRHDAELVLLLRDTRLNYSRLERAANSLRQGARLIVSNPDRTHRGRGGRLVPETGALLAALLASAGDSTIPAEVIGKPHGRLLAKACALLNIAPGQAVMIGDNPETDGAGADRFGMPHILVGGESGVAFDDLPGAER